MIVVVVDHGLVTCSFLKNLKKPMGMMSWNARQIHSHLLAMPGMVPSVKSGKVAVGWLELGLVARAKIVATPPMI